VEIAEKRALSRAVLKICGAYRYGVFGEDESDDFKKPRRHSLDANIALEDVNLTQVA